VVAAHVVSRVVVVKGKFQIKLYHPDWSTSVGQVYMSEALQGHVSIIFVLRF
jgi:hypothetical protein